MKKELLLYRYVDGINDTPFPSAEEQISLTSFTYNAQRMAATPTITASFNYPRCLDNDWDVNVYAEFNGERYYIRQIPSSSKDNKSVMYKHDITLYSERFVLENIYLYDVLKNDDTNVIIRCDLKDFTEVLNRSFQKSGLKYRVSIDNSVANTEKALEVKDIALDKVYLSVALQEIYNQWGISYYFEGYNIIVKDCSVHIYDNVLEYGYDKSLLSIKKENANFRKITRCSGYGSDKNIPFFYPNLSQKGVIGIAPLDNNKILTKDLIEIVDLKKFDKNMPLNGNVIYKSKQTYTPNVNKKLEGTKYPESFRRLDKPTPLEYNFQFNSEISSTYVTFSADLQMVERFTCMGNGKTIWSFPLEQLVKYVKATLLLDGTSVSSSGGKECPTEVIVTEYEPSIQSPLHLREPSDLKTYKKVLDFIIVRSFKITVTSFLSNSDPINSNSDYNYNFKLKFYPALSQMSTDNITIGKWYNGVGKEFDIKERTAGTSSFSLNNIRFDYSSLNGNEAGWFLNDTKQINLSDIGVQIKSTPTNSWNNEGFKQVVISKIPTATNLMPPLYRESLGNEKFYNAKDNTYLNDDNEYYDFETEWTEVNQNEHIQPFDEIYPTITNIINADNVPFDEILDVAFDDNDNNEVDEEGNFLHPYFYVKIAQFNGSNGFNLFDHKIVGGNMQVSFTSGECSACLFDIMVKTRPNINNEDYEDVVNPIKTENGALVSGDWRKKTAGNFGSEDATQQNSQTNSIWLVLRKDDQTFGTTLPDSTNGVIPKKGDKFVLLNIEMPQQYIDSAEELLRKNIIQYMWENNSDKWNFTIDFSRIFLQENQVFVNDLSENAKVRVKYNGIIYDFYVNSFTYEVKSNEPLPKIKIGLADTLSINRSITQAIASGVMKDVQSQLNGVAYLGDLNEQFLRKRYDETMPNNMTFEKNVNVEGNIMSNTIKSTKYTNEKFTGSGFLLEQDAEGKSTLIVDYAKIRNKLDVYELVINQLKAQGGTLLITSASMECNKVETYEVEGYYRCFFDTKNNSVYNQFEVNDLVRCQKFGAIIKYYWRKVVGIGDNYIDLSISECDKNSDIPTEGDVIVQMGNTENKDRQSIIELSSNGEYSPSFIMYSDIDDFSLANKEITGITKQPNIYEVDEDGITIKDENGNPIVKENSYPHFFSYGSMYFGSRNKEDNYISFQKNEQGEFEMIINAKTTFKGSTKNISDALNEIETQNIESINNISIGGDNIIIGADKYPSKDNAFTKVWENNVMWHYSSLDVDLEAGQSYILTAYSTGQWKYTEQDKNDGNYVNVLLELPDPKTPIFGSNRRLLQDGRLCMTLNCTISGRYKIYFESKPFGGSNSFWQVQVEKGSVPSDWKPTSISSIQSTTNQTKNELANLTIGGENLLLGAYKYPSKDKAFSFTSDRDDDYHLLPELTCELVAGQIYTLTAYTDGKWVDVEVYNGEDKVNQVDAWVTFDDGSGYKYINMTKTGRYEGGETLSVKKLNDGRLCTTFIPAYTKEYNVRFDIDYVGNNRKFWQVQIEKGNMPSDWKPAEIDTVKPLYDALKGSTEIEGGLISTNVLMVKDSKNAIKGGISGVDDNIAFWSGGTYQDAVKGNCNVIIRKDGTAKIGSFQIKKDTAEIQLSNGNKATMSTNGIRINLSNGGTATYGIDGVIIKDLYGKEKIKLVDKAINFSEFRKTPKEGNLSSISDVYTENVGITNFDVNYQDETVDFTILNEKNNVTINFNISELKFQKKYDTLYNNRIEIFKVSVLLISTETSSYSKEFYNCVIRIQTSIDNYNNFVYRVKKVENAQDMWNINWDNVNSEMTKQTNEFIVLNNTTKILSLNSQLSLNSYKLIYKVEPASSSYASGGITIGTSGSLTYKVEEYTPKTIIGTNGFMNFQTSYKYFGAYLDLNTYKIEAKGDINLNGKTY